jgi:hypothetical protein
MAGSIGQFGDQKRARVAVNVSPYRNSLRFLLEAQTSSQSSPRSLNSWPKIGDHLIPAPSIHEHNWRTKRDRNTGHDGRSTDDNERGERARTRYQGDE